MAISGMIVDIILFFIIAGNAVLGYKRGLTNLVFSLCSGVIALILVSIFYRPLTNFIVDYTPIDEKMQSIFENQLAYLFEKNNIENAEQLQGDSNISSVLKVFIGDEIVDLAKETIDSVVQFIAVDIAYKIIGTVVYFVLFSVIRIALYIFKNYIEMVANLPIIRIINASGGMIYGVIRGFFIIYVILAIVSFILPIAGGTILLTAIQNAPIGSKMFQNNILLNFIFYFL